MVRHATSHGASLLICSIIGSFLVEVLKSKLPNLMLHVEGFSYRAVSLFNFPISVENFSIILIASILSLAWGVFFKLRYQ